LVVVVVSIVEGGRGVPVFSRFFCLTIEGRVLGS